MLSPPFLARLGAAAARVDTAALEPLLASLLTAAQAAWPGLALPADAFAADLADRVAGSADPLAALQGLHATDLFVSRAVVRAVPGALEAFEQRYFPEIAKAVCSLDRSPSFADDVQQILRERLFMNASASSGIAQYAGKGPLSKWLRISALRVVARLKEGQERETDLDRLDQLADRALHTTASDPEVDYLKSTYRREFRQAFHDALAALSPRERNVLRLHTLDKLNGEQIAAFYGVSRASSSRWLSHARETLHVRTRALLAERLGLGTSQLESLAGLVLSQLDLSLDRVLGE